MSDLLRMDYINSLPQPFMVREYGRGEWWWPVIDIDVETGVMRIDVCGLPEAKHFSDFKVIRDDDGIEHDPDTWYNEDESETQA